MDNTKIGNGIRILGWAVVLINAIKYGYGIFETLSDPSVRVYALLVAIEGAMYVTGGLILVWVGNRIRKNAKKSEIPAE